MANIRPFHGVRYNLDRVEDMQQVVTPPYDVISEAEQAAFYETSPVNIIRVDLGKSLPGDSDADNKYTRAGRTFRDWLDQGILQVEPAPAYYVYRQGYRLPDGTKRSVTGFIGAMELSPWDEGICLPHEHTFSKPKADRLFLMRTTEANLSQVYAFFSEREARVDQVLADVVAQDPPIISVQDDDGNGHEVWVVTDPGCCETIRRVMIKHPVFIADGHHRYETALEYRDEMRRLHPDAPENQGWNYAMMMFVNLDGGGLTILPTHRIVKGLASVDAEAALDALAPFFTLETIELSGSKASALEKAIDRPGHIIGMYTGDGQAVILTLKESAAVFDAVDVEGSHALKDLDVTLLHHLVLKDGFGLDDVAQDSGDYVGYTRDSAEAIATVDSGQAQLAFVLNWPSVEQVRAVALAGDVMPHKSTYFYPKLLTGLVMNDLRQPIPEP